MINYEIHIKIDKMLPACINDLIYVFFIANKNMIYCFQGAKGTITGQVKKRDYKIYIHLFC